MNPEVLEYFQKIGKKGGEKIKKKYGREHYVKMAKKGGATTRKRYGKEYYKALQAKSVKSRMRKKVIHTSDLQSNK